MAEGHNIEMENALFGKVKLSSPELNTILTILTFVGVVLLLYILFTHENQAAAGDKATAEALIRSNQQTAEVLKETTNNNMRSLDRVAEALEKAARAQDKTNCLLAIPPDRRNQAEELCDRILRRR